MLGQRLYSSSINIPYIQTSASSAGGSIAAVRAGDLRQSMAPPAGHFCGACPQPIGPMLPSDIMYGMLHQKARALRTIRPDRSLEILCSLELANPADIGLKREIAELHFRSGRFDDASFIWFYVYTKTRSDSDLVFLVCSCVYNEGFRLFLRDIKIHASCRNSVLRSAIAEILAKDGFFDYRRFFSQRGGDPGIAGPGHAVARDGVARDPAATSAKADPWLAHDDFCALYSRSLEHIAFGRVATGLGILLQIFRCGSCLELLDLLKSGEKMELLFFLSEASPFFGRYFEETVTKINRDKVSVLRLVLSKCERHDWRGLVKLL